MLAEPPPALRHGLEATPQRAPVTGVELASALGERVTIVIDDGPVPFPAGTTVVEVAGGRWRVLRQGAVPADVIERQTACLVVFVCTGNTCRSPMAEAMCKKRLSERLGCTPEELPRRGFVVVSAGLSTFPGLPASAEAVAVAAAHGADLSGHRSRDLSAELLLHADCVLGMTRDHVEVLMEALGHGLESVPGTNPPRLLSPEGEDLADPVGREHAVYEQCAAAIWKHVDTLTAELLGQSSPDRAAP